MINFRILRKQTMLLSFAVVLVLMNCTTTKAAMQKEAGVEASSNLTELPTAKHLVELGEKYREAGDNLKALDYFDKAIKADPSYAPAYTYKGMFYARIKEYAKALPNFKEAIRLIPHPKLKDIDIIPYVLYGFCNLELDNNEQAIQDFSKVLEINPYYSDGYNFQGLAYFKLGQYKEAEERYTIAIYFGKMMAGVPQNQYYLNRGRAYIMLGDYEKAIDDFTKSIELKPDAAEVYVERGSIYNFLEKYDKALNDFTRAIILETGFTAAYLGCGVAYFNTGKYEDAADAFTKAEKIVPSIYAYVGRGMALIYLRNYEAAINDFNQALKLSPIDQKIYKMRGIAYLHWGKYREAMNDFDESIRLDPNDLETRQGREEAYKALNSNMANYRFIMPPTKLHANPIQQTVKDAKRLEGNEK